MRAFKQEALEWKSKYNSFVQKLREKDAQKTVSQEHDQQLDVMWEWLRQQDLAASCRRMDGCTHGTNCGVRHRCFFGRFRYAR